MKKIFLAALLWMLAMACASASVVSGAEYTNVPGTPTQDAVVEIRAEITPAGQDAQEYQVEALAPYDLTIQTLGLIQDFVRDEQAPPARYFPQEVQREIERILEGADPDSLHMTEFMSVLHQARAEEAGRVDAQFLLDVDYQPGQLVVVVIGDGDDPGNIQWTPLEAQVLETGLISFSIPPELLTKIQGVGCLLSVLTTRQGQRGGIIEYREIRQRVEFPSKTAKDIIRIEKIYKPGGDELPDDFAILITDETEAITQEFQRIYQYVRQEGNSLISYFDDAVGQEILLLLPEGIDPDSLLAYEAVPVTAVNYKETYGDAVAGFQFATPYQPGQNAVALIGLSAGEDSPMEWAILNTVIQQDTVDITFKQRVLPVMEEQGGGLMLVLSEPLAEDNP